MEGKPGTRVVGRGGCYGPLLRAGAHAARARPGPYNPQAPPAAEQSTGAAIRISCASPMCAAAGGPLGASFAAAAAGSRVLARSAAAAVGRLLAGLVGLPGRPASECAAPADASPAPTARCKLDDSVWQSTPVLSPLGAPFTPEPCRRPREHCRGQQLCEWVAAGRARAVAQPPPSWLTAGTAGNSDVERQRCLLGALQEQGASTVARGAGLCAAHEARTTQSLSGRDFWKVQIESIYCRRNPLKLQKVPALLDKYRGKEVVLYKKVCLTYDLDPMKFYADPAAWQDEAEDDAGTVLSCGHAHLGAILHGSESPHEKPPMDGVSTVTSSDLMDKHGLEADRQLCITVRDSDGCAGVDIVRGAGFAFRFSPIGKAFEPGVGAASDSGSRITLKQTSPFAYLVSTPLTAETTHDAALEPGGLPIWAAVDP